MLAKPFLLKLFTGKSSFVNQNNLNRRISAKPFILTPVVQKKQNQKRTLDVNENSKGLKK